MRFVDALFFHGRGKTIRNVFWDSNRLKEYRILPDGKCYDFTDSKISS